MPKAGASTTTSANAAQMGAERATEPPSVYHHNDGKPSRPRRADRAEQTQTAPQIGSRSPQAQTEPRRRYNTTTRRKQGSPRRIYAEQIAPQTANASKPSRTETQTETAADDGKRETVSRRALVLI